METTTLLRLLEWYQNNGINIPVYDQPCNHLENLKGQMQMSSQFSIDLLTHKDHPAEACQSLEDLRETMLAFESCSLKQSAMNLVFADGNSQAKIMFVGEAPGADEDRQGLPFVGQSGQLLDRMLKAVGLDRTQVYISNIIPWRPPGNRPPTPSEIAVCQPFIQKHIQLVQPKILICLGGVAAKTLLNSSEGIMKLRGKWRDYPLCNDKTVKAMATFHPAYLLRSPGQKALVWRDFLMIKEAFEEETL